MAGITRWLAAHPTLGRWALFFYATFLVQQFVVLLLLAWKKSRTTMWRYVSAVSCSDGDRTDHDRNMAG